MVVRQHVPGAAHVEVLRAGSDPLVPDELPAQSHFQLRYHLALSLRALRRGGRKRAPRSTAGAIPDTVLPLLAAPVLHSVL